MVTEKATLADNFKQATIWQQDAVDGRPEPAIQITSLVGDCIKIQQSGEEIYINRASAAHVISVLQEFAREPVARKP